MVKIPVIEYNKGSIKFILEVSDKISEFNPQKKHPFGML